MTVEIRMLDPHDAMPEGRPHRVIVLRRFDEDDPRRVITQIELTAARGRSEAVQPTGPDGAPMPLDAAIDAARKVAESEGIPVVHVLDRTAGHLERALLASGGDHSFPGLTLDDADLKDGEAGPDMRDRTPFPGP